MAVAGSGKWEQLGMLLIRCAGPNLGRLQSGLNAGLAAEKAMAGSTLSDKAAPIKRKRRNAERLVETT